MTTDAETTAGQAEEQSQAINQLDDTLQQLIATFDELDARLDRLHADMMAGFQQLNARFDELNARLDRTSYVIMGVGGGVIAALVGLIVTLVVQGSP